MLLSSSSLYASNGNITSNEVSISSTYEEILPFGLGAPSKDKVVDLNSKALDFSGDANNSTLYTNSNFKGKSTVSYEITNKLNRKLTVKVYKYGDTFAKKTFTISSNSTESGTITGLESDSLYYLGFSAPSDFSGKLE